VLYGADHAALSLEPLLQLPNVTTRPFEQYREDQVDLVHFPDPLRLADGHGSPFSLFAHGCRTALVNETRVFAEPWTSWPESLQRCYGTRVDELRTSDCIILTGSVSARSDLLRLLALPPDRVVSITPGPSTDPAPFLTQEQTMQGLATQIIELWTQLLDPNPLESDRPMNVTIRLNKLCQARDFAPLQVYSQQLGCAYTPGQEVRKVWELAMAICTFTECVPPGRIRALGVGAGKETTTYWLTKHCEQVHCTDIYAQSGSWQADASPTMLIDPASTFNGFPWNPRRLIVQHMDGCNLRYEDSTFEFIYSSSSIEHFGEVSDACQAMREMGRVLKPGGILSCSTEFKVAGPGKGFDNVITFDQGDICRLIEASGLRLIDDLDLTPDPAREASFMRAISDVEQHGMYQEWPHIKLEHRGYIWTSVHLALFKPLDVNDTRGITIEDWKARQRNSTESLDDLADPLSHLDWPGRVPRRV
jgi:SAM-dependent methyltransferase